MKKLSVLVAVTLLTLTSKAQQPYWGTNGSPTSPILFTFPSSTSVNIGAVLAPQEKLEINGSGYVNAENNGFIVDAAGYKRVGLMKYNGTEGVLGRTSGQDFGFTRNNSTTDVKSPSGLVYDMYISGTGLVGIGPNQTNPQAYLHLTTPNNSSAGFILEHSYTSPYSFAQLTKVNSDQTAGLSIVRKNGTTETTVFNVWGNGDTKIGAAVAPAVHANPKLSVDGKIICRDLYVLSTTVWPDYVFSDNYKLKSLNELKSFYMANKHLPGVPTAKEIGEKGINISEITTIQMEKIEELTIYLIQLKEEVEQLRKENEILKTKIK